MPRHRRLRISYLIPLHTCCSQKTPGPPPSPPSSETSSNTSPDRASSRKPALSPGNDVLIWGSQLQRFAKDPRGASPTGPIIHLSFLATHKHPDPINKLREQILGQCLVCYQTPWPVPSPPPTPFLLEEVLALLPWPKGREGCMVGWGGRRGLLPRVAVPGRGRKLHHHSTITFSFVSLAGSQLPAVAGFRGSRSPAGRVQDQLWLGKESRGRRVGVGARTQKDEAWGRGERKGEGSEKARERKRKGGERGQRGPRKPVRTSLEPGPVPQPPTLCPESYAP